MTLWTPTQTAVKDDLKEVDFGVCLWRLGDNNYLQNEDGDFLCAQGKIGDPKIEQRMKEAVVLYFDIHEGIPAWLPGSRKISQSEHEDQMAELLDGGTPDPVDVYRQAHGK